MEAICGQAGSNAFTGIGCFIYDFQTRLTGLAAIIVAIFAGVPVWRQLKDTNLQTRISHRETLANLLRDALDRYEKVDRSIREPLSLASRLTSDFEGGAFPIDTEDAHHLEQAFSGILDWYLVVLEATEEPDIEARKAGLKAALKTLLATLLDAHLADHNDQQQDDQRIPDDEWASIVTRCAEAKIEAATRVTQVEAAYRDLRAAQRARVQSLRTQIAKLDLRISSPQ